jgi:hypothetical protein
MSFEVTFGDVFSGRDFTGASSLHFWIRVVDSGGVLQAFQPFVQGGALASYAGTYQPYVAGFDNTWHEYLAQVTDQPYLSSVWKLGIQFFSPTVPVNPGPDAGDMETDIDAADAQGSVGTAEASAADAGASVDSTAEASGEAAAAASDAEGGTSGDAQSGQSDASVADGGARGPFVVHIDYVWIN